MFLHVGGDVVVSLRRIIAILDLKSVNEAESSREFIQLAQRGKHIVDVAGGDGKSLVVTDSEAYLSPISSLTLKKRADFLSSNIITDLDG